MRCQDKLRMVGGIRTLSETLKSHLNPNSNPDDCDLSLLLHIVRAICAATSGNSMFNYLFKCHNTLYVHVCTVCWKTWNL